jgi:hypothetical protein
MPYKIQHDACPTCDGQKKRTSKQCATCARAADAAVSPQSTIAEDRERRRQQSAVATLQAKYSEALKQIEQQERELEAMGVLRQGVETTEIRPREGSGTSEGTVVAVMSDWHCEEVVDPRTVSGLNRHDIETSWNRSRQLFQGALRLTRLLNQDIKIHTMAIALLGDFITNELHDAESAEGNELQPTHAIVTAQNMLISGIEFLLNHSPYQLAFNCHSGNHGRTTKKTRFSAENGHSLEYLMYLHLAAYFRNEPRVTFSIAEGYHSYLDIYGQIVRLHHGHAVKYGGGVGGIYIPAHKAIANWNRAKTVNLDVFGHFHQMVDGGSFICNGSMIGYNGFAVAIKAPFEPPKQALFLMDKRRGRTCTWPILFNDKKVA